MNPGAGVEAPLRRDKDSAFALNVEHVSKTYTPLGFFGLDRSSAKRRAVKALDDVSFSIRAGDMFGLLGPNGAGKTTLLKIMTTLVHPSSGRVSLLGRDIREKPRWTRRMIGLVTCDERSFYWRLTGRHNLKFFAALYGVPDREADARMEELFDTLELTSAADRPYHSYSSGMKQKLAIARGFISDPMVLFYDEPTRSLDPVSAQRIRNWIAERRKKFPHQTHIIATNHLYEAEQLCDGVAIFAHGRLLAQGSIREICATAGPGAGHPSWRR
jgi:ABC-2 type transport system ATP-binding protein